MSSSSLLTSRTSSPKCLKRLWIHKSLPPVPPEGSDSYTGQAEGYSHLQGTAYENPYAIDECPRTPSSVLSQDSPGGSVQSPASAYSDDSFEGDIRHPLLCAEEDDSTITFATPPSPDDICIVAARPIPTPIYVPPPDFRDRALLTPISEQTEIESILDVHLDYSADRDAVRETEDAEDDRGSLARTPSLSESMCTASSEVSCGCVVGGKTSCGSLSVSTPATEVSHFSEAVVEHGSGKVLRRVDRKWYRPRELGLPGVEERDLLDSDCSDEEGYY
ncbi:hypothetical protein OE88DRAFT_1733479 [Heliocybe sulcata]|uniref:Uncharacterized protein n=1 Tax=Heliocybe sulcata TaxID=5364 RepID=A0A5C3NC47_9AGAM|nr:hypothetical protein OE88DRAFT_1733479 [Heliocybe sulcata]